jgi:predicted ferric reductase
MKNAKRSFWLLLITLSALWLLADTPAPRPLSYFSLRSVILQYTGVISIGLMSAIMVLAIRPKWLERPLHGLDKMYLLHRWLGIATLVVAALHWWWAQGTKWMVQWGWLHRPGHRPSHHALSSTEQWLASQRGMAETLGDWAFYGLVILIAVALIRLIPYHFFQKTHWLIAIAYLLLVYHSVILTKFAYWSQPVGWAMAILMGAGTFSALLVLTGRVGIRRKVPGTIKSLAYYPSLRVLEVSVELGKAWKGHIAGQFAFVTSFKTEGAHPYTMASDWNPTEPCVTFIVKELGDYTRRLHELLMVGMPVTVEGPYGCFTFEDNAPRQIWVGSGIGITPFIARMKHLAKRPGTQEIDLFHSTHDYEPTAIDKLSSDAHAANVRLHVVVTSTEQRLNAERLCAAIPEWRSASVWFCGPLDFGESLRAALLKKGLPPEHFHLELFEMR